MFYEERWCQGLMNQEVVGVVRSLSKPDKRGVCDTRVLLDVDLPKVEQGCSVLGVSVQQICLLQEPAANHPSHS